MNGIYTEKDICFLEKALGTVKRLKQYVSANTQIKYVHFMHLSNWTDAFVTFFNTYFKKEEHIFFCLITDQPYQAVPTAENYFEIDTFVVRYIEVIKILINCKKIYMHGMWHPIYIDLLAENPQLNKKAAWVIWGGDLYNIDPVGNRAIVAKNCAEIISASRKDYELAQSKYHVQGKWLRWFGPAPHDLKSLENNFRINSKKEFVNILVGHSAYEGLEHERFFRLIKDRYGKENINVFSGLSYGDKKYAEKVIKLGENFFGDRFHPMTTYIKGEIYVKFLSRIDIAIFAPERNIAGGTSEELLYLGKKLYLHPESTFMDVFREFGFEVFSIEDIASLTYDQFIANDFAQHNHEIAKQFFDDSLNIKTWQINLEA